jgi:hypothetical protein
MYRGVLSGVLMSHYKPLVQRSGLDTVMCRRRARGGDNARFLGQYWWCHDDPGRRDDRCRHGRRRRAGQSGRRRQGRQNRRHVLRRGDARQPNSQ